MKKTCLLLIGLILTIEMNGQVEFAYPLKSSLWKNHSIKVCWENPKKSNLNKRELVSNVIDSTWALHSNLSFIGWDKCRIWDKESIRIRIKDERPRVKKLGNQLKGKKGGMVLNFTFKKWSRSCRKDNLEFCLKATSVHEFGHAIGLAHEQNRNDCDFEGCDEEPNGENGDWYITQCDLNSIMNYCNPKWNNNGLLSELDIKAVKMMYGDSLSIDSGNNMFSSPPDLVYTSKRIINQDLDSQNKIYHIFKIYLNGNDSAMDDINSIKYLLNDRFKSKSVIVSDRNSKFGLKLGLQDNFILKAIVYRTDGTSFELSKDLKLTN